MDSGLAGFTGAPEWRGWYRNPSSRSFRGAREVREPGIHNPGRASWPITSIFSQPARMARPGGRLCARFNVHYRRVRAGVAL